MKARWVASVALALMCGGQAVLFADHGQATPAVPELIGYNAVASANGIRITEAIPNYLAVGDDVVDAGGPIAQSVASSGSLQSFASLPYPGDLIVSLPSLLGGFGIDGAPSYPFYVSATTAKPTDHLRDPSGQYALEADVAADHTTATGGFGQANELAGSGTEVSSTSSIVTKSDGTIIATATSLVQGLNVAGVLKIGSITSSATATLAPGTTAPTTSSNVVIDAATVAGQGISIGPDGLQVLGLTLPGSANAIEKLLATSGIRMRVLRPHRIKNGIETGSLEISMSKQLTVASNPTATTTLQFGSSLASIEVGSSGLAPTTPPSSTLTPPASHDHQQPSGAVSTGLPGSLPTTPSDTSVPPPSVAPVQQQQTVLLARDLKSRIRLVYLIITIGAVAGWSTMTLWRSKGARATCIS